MPSPEHAADLERVLTRATQECESKQGVWFGDGLPQAVQSGASRRGNIDSHEEPAGDRVRRSERRVPGGTRDHGRRSSLPELNCPVVGLSDSLPSKTSAQLVGAGTPKPGIQITRLICPVAVFDFTSKRAFACARCVTASRRRTSRRG